MVASLSDVILQRLEQTVPLQQQVVSVEDRIALEEIQSSLTVVLLVSVLPLSPKMPFANGFRLSSNDLRVR
jgi:importin subunit beta-1